MKPGDTVIVSQCGIEVEAVILATSPYSAYPAMAGQDGTMYHVQSEEWFGNSAWVTEDRVRPVEEKKLEFIISSPLQEKELK